MISNVAIAGQRNRFVRAVVWMVGWMVILLALVKNAPGLMRLSHNQHMTNSDSFMKLIRLMPSILVKVS